MKNDNQYIHQWLLAEKAINDVYKPLIVEIGAHIGDDTKFFIENYANSEIIAFEPDPRNFEVLTKRFGFNKSIALYNYALSDKTGITSFFKSIEQEVTQKSINKNLHIKDFGFDPNNLLGSASSSLIFPSHLKGESIKVNTRKLDDFDHELEDKEIFLTWIDVQGAEKMVIDGGRKYLNRSKFIWIEYGEIEYPNALTREETVDCFKATHKVIGIISNHANKGNLLLKLI